MRSFALLCLAIVLTTAHLSETVRGEQRKYIASISADGIQRIEVLAGEYFFDPDYIVVKMNVPVEIRIRKEANAIPPDFVIEAPEAGIQVNESLSSEPKTISFRPTKAGKFPFYCDKKLLFFKSHRAKGMEGVLEVRD